MLQLSSRSAVTTLSAAEFHAFQRDWRKNRAIVPPHFFDAALLEMVRRIFAAPDSSTISTRRRGARRR
jgi:hypothetical protein